jgi:predicted MFS family arabinose efflux permease
MTFADALRGWRLWAIGLSFLLFCSGTGGSIPHMIPMLIDRGLSSDQAAGVAALSGAGLLIGRIAGGWLLDRFSAPAVAAVVVGSPSLFCLVLGFGGGGEALILATAITIGVAAGAEFDIVAFMVSRYFGLRQYGLIYGALYGFFVCGTALAPPLFGWMYDTRGNYDLVLVTAGAFFGTGALLVLTLGRPPRTVA